MLGSLSHFPPPTICQDVNSALGSRGTNITLLSPWHPAKLHYSVGQAKHDDFFVPIPHNNPATVFAERDHTPIPPVGQRRSKTAKDGLSSNKLPLQYSNSFQHSTTGFAERHTTRRSSLSVGQVHSSVKSIRWSNSPVGKIHPLIKFTGRSNPFVGQVHPLVKCTGRSNPSVG